MLLRADAFSVARRHCLLAITISQNALGRIHCVHKSFSFPLAHLPLIDSATAFSTMRDSKKRKATTESVKVARPKTNDSKSTGKSIEASPFAEFGGKTKDVPLKVSPGRVRELRKGSLKDGPVIYWMSRDQRSVDNWALIYAIQKVRYHDGLAKITAKKEPMTVKPQCDHSLLLNPLMCARQMNSCLNITMSPMVLLLH